MRMIQTVCGYIPFVSHTRVAKPLLVVLLVLVGGQVGYVARMRSERHAR